MNPETLIALNGSIAHWLSNSKAKTPADASTHGSACSLCDMFLVPKTPCVDCPVSKYTGKMACDGSPYNNADRAWNEWQQNPDDPDLATKFRALATEEYEFLKGLLPK